MLTFFLDSEIESVILTEFEDGTIVENNNIKELFDQLRKIPKIIIFFSI